MAYQKLQAGRALNIVPSDTVDIPNPAAQVTSGLTDGVTTALKLISSGGKFSDTNIKYGDIIYDTTNMVATTVTAVDSTTQLSVVAAAGIATGANYVIFRAERLSPSNGSVLFAGLAGDIKITTTSGDIVTLQGLAAGQFIPVQVTRVWETDTTSTTYGELIALW